MFLALFRGVTMVTLIELPGMLHLLGGAFMILALSGIVALVKRLARGARPSGPWRYRAWPTEDEPVGGLVIAKVTIQLAHLVAMAVTGLAAVAAIAFDGALAAGLLQGFLLVLVSGALAGVILTAAIRIEWLVRWLHSLRRPISRARP